MLAMVQKIDVVRKEVWIDCGLLYKLPFSYLPKDIIIGTYVFLNQKTGKFERIKEQNES
jgi:hypothetical protein